jgi:hypothetical protein
METMINPYKMLAGKPESKGTLGRLRHRWEGQTSIKFDLKELGVDWIHLS